MHCSSNPNVHFNPFMTASAIYAERRKWAFFLGTAYMHNCVLEVLPKHRDQAVANSSWSCTNDPELGSL